MHISPALWVPLVLLFAAAAWDLAKREIPNVVPLALVVWAVASRLLGFQEANWLSAGAGLAVGLAIGLVLFALNVMGAGDGKLLAGLGSILGPLGLLAVLPWIALTGGVFALWGRHRGHAEVVYGPAIAIGYGLALLL